MSLWLRTSVEGASETRKLGIWTLGVPWARTHEGASETRKLGNWNLCPSRPDPRGGLGNLETRNLEFVNQPRGPPGYLDIAQFAHPSGPRAVGSVSTVLHTSHMNTVRSQSLNHSHALLSDGDPATRRGVHTRRTRGRADARARPGARGAASGIGRSCLKPGGGDLSQSR